MKQLKTKNKSTEITNEKVNNKKILKIKAHSKSCLLKCLDYREC